MVPYHAAVPKDKRTPRSPNWQGVLQHLSRLLSHFPMYIKLNYEPRAELLQKEPEEPNGDEKEWAEEKIDNANPLEEDL